jgi:hypothetical protein
MTIDAAQMPTQVEKSLMESKLYPRRNAAGNRSEELAA